MPADAPAVNQRPAADLPSAMGFGMNRTGSTSGAINGNIKSDFQVKQFCIAAGLDVEGFPEYLLQLVAQGHELGGLSNEDWNQILGPMELPREHIARVHTAISNVRKKAAEEAEELNRKLMHRHIVEGGAHPMARPGAEVCAPKLNGASTRSGSKTVDDSDGFIPVHFFQGEKPGYTFKHGNEGLGYYKDARARGAAGAAGADRQGPIMTNVARGYNPVSQAGLEDMTAAQQQRAYTQYTQSKQQQLLSERRQRMEERQHGYSQGQVANMYANARLRSSPFATGY